MRNAVQPQYPIQDGAAEIFGRVARSIARAPASLHDLPARSANDAEFVRRVASDAAAPHPLAASALHRLIARFERRRQRRATVRALRALDERALRNIGLNGSEILSIACEIEYPALATRALVAHYPRCR